MFNRKGHISRQLVRAATLAEGSKPIDNKMVVRVYQLAQGMAQRDMPVLWTRDIY